MISEVLEQFNLLGLHQENATSKCQERPLHREKKRMKVNDWFGIDADFEWGKVMDAGLEANFKPLNS